MSNLDFLIDSHLKKPFSYKDLNMNYPLDKQNNLKDHLQEELEHLNPYHQKKEPKIFSSNQYIICILQVGSHKVIYSPDFQYFFTVPSSQDPHRWTSISIQQVEIEIEKKLAALSKEGKSHPTPKKLAEIFHQENFLSKSNQHPTEQQHLLTIRQTATRLNLSCSTIRRLSQNGTLKCSFTPRGHRRFSQKQVQEFLNHTKNRVAL